MSVKAPAPKQSRIAAMIAEQSVKAKEMAKSVASKVDESTVQSTDPMANTVKAAIEVAGLTDIQVSGSDQDGMISLQATIPEAVTGEYLIFEYRPTSPVLIVKGANSQLPSIPVEAKDLSDLIANAAVSYFQGRIAKIEDAATVPTTDTPPPGGKPAANPSATTTTTSN